MKPKLTELFRIKEAGMFGSVDGAPAPASSGAVTTATGAQVGKGTAISVIARIAGDRAMETALQPFAKKLETSLASMTPEKKAKAITVLETSLETFLDSLLAAGLS